MKYVSLYKIAFLTLSLIFFSFLRLFVRAWAIHLYKQEGSNACSFWRSKIKYTNQPTLPIIFESLEPQVSCVVLRERRIMLEKVADSARRAVKLTEPYKPYGGQFLEFCSISLSTYQTCMKLTRQLEVPNSANFSAGRIRRTLVILACTGQSSFLQCILYPLF